MVGGLDLGESDRLVRILSASRGRSTVVARRARASKRRFAGLFELGNAVRISARGRGELPAVTDADLVRTPLRARDDLGRIALLAYGCEVCASLAPEESASERLFGLLDAWVSAVDAPTIPHPAARPALEAKALTFAGLAPRLVDCARCGAPLADPAVWDPEAGGGMHAACGAGRPVSTALLADLERVRRIPLAEIRAGPRSWLLAEALEHALGRALASRRMLDLAGEGM